MSKDDPLAPQLIRGRCLCGSFQFQIIGPIGEVRLCHCDLCRRANGTASSANATISLKQYHVISGEDLISEYESSPGARRCFCSRCGSPVFARVAKDPGHIRIRLGTLDRETDAEITAHVWVGSKARWDRLTWAIPLFERGIDSPLAQSSHERRIWVESKILRRPVVAMLGLPYSEVLAWGNTYDQHSCFIASYLPRNPH